MKRPLLLISLSLIVLILFGMIVVLLVKNSELKHQFENQLNQQSGYNDRLGPQQSDSSSRKEPDALGFSSSREPPNTALFKSRIAIVIDDVGNNLQELSPFLEFPGPLTFAVLPQLPHSASAANLVKSYGHEVILHQPMTAINGLNPGPGNISMDMTDTQIRNLLEQNFSSITGAVGTNNHMGSRATSDSRIMNTIMAYLSETGRFFIDSRTTSNTVAFQYAKKYKVPFLERDIFLDHDRSPVAIRQALQNGLRVAKETGQVVLIGHSSVTSLAEILLEKYSEIERQGHLIVPVSTLFNGYENKLSNIDSKSWLIP